jgi:DnaD/phage-associated family protein
MKKTWIKIKRGLLTPEHRNKMGVRIWLYMHMIDKVDWETGVIFEWRDKDEAEDFGMPWRTLQDQRQQLENDEYITCLQVGQHQNITIHNWVNPREYSGKEYNPNGQGYGESRTLPVGVDESEGTDEGTGEGNRKPRTLPYTSHITDHIPDGQVYSHYENNIGTLTKTIGEVIGSAIEEYPNNWITEAIDIAVVNNKRSWSYAEAILKRWDTEGKDNGKKPVKEPYYVEVH